jgi:D-sedoheptulose 7-phosphate isomerase
MNDVISYFTHLCIAAKKIDSIHVELAVDVMYNTWKKGGRINICGNGGSMSTASHFSVDLSKGIKVVGKAPVLTCSLDSPSEITALANDEFYRDVFWRMMENKSASKDDCIVAISSSGNSPNITAALKYSKVIGMPSILITGNNRECDSCDTADVVIYISDTEMARHEDLHLALCHCMAFMLKKRICNE